ncbi:MAG: hypothetical protein ACKVP4_05680 [Hyphomicrobium sp.]
MIGLRSAMAHPNRLCYRSESSALRSLALGLALTAFLAFLAAAVATRLSIPWLARAGESDRTMHSGFVPQGGGAALLASAFATAALTGAVNAAFMLAVIALAALSWRNDHAHISANVRLACHLTVATAYVSTLPDEARVLQGLFPFAVDRMATVLALSWMMNLFNFMDGINGLAGAETIAIAAGYLLLAGAPSDHATLAAALAGASGGFLVWNLRGKALVFLGDVGSVPLGFITGALMIDLALRGFWAAALILPAYFVADATLTLLTRLLRGESASIPHRAHFYQRAAQGLGSHLSVVARVAVANALLIVLATWSIYAPWLALAGAVAVVGGLLFELSRVAVAPIRSSDSDP